MLAGAWGDYTKSQCLEYEVSKPVRFQTVVQPQAFSEMQKPVRRCSISGSASVDFNDRIGALRSGGFASGERQVPAQAGIPVPAASGRKLVGFRGKAAMPVLVRPLASKAGL